MSVSFIFSEQIISFFKISVKFSKITLSFLKSHWRFLKCGASFLKQRVDCPERLPQRRSAIMMRCGSSLMAGKLAKVGPTQNAKYIKDQTIFSINKSARRCTKNVELKFSENEYWLKK